LQGIGIQPSRARLTQRLQAPIRQRHRFEAGETPLKVGRQALRPRGEAIFRLQARALSRLHLTGVQNHRLQREAAQQQHQSPGD
jgi:hypothetical protein